MKNTLRIWRESCCLSVNEVDELLGFESGSTHKYELGGLLRVPMPYLLKLRTLYKISDESFYQCVEDAVSAFHEQEKQ
ncbi:MAG: hypothetical protein R3A80_04355 [Bdellovibrionota bacterium]